MSLAPEKKAEIIKTFGSSQKDTGSTVVQIALLTERIKMLSGHLKSHPKDVHSRRGLFKLVGLRSSLTSYLKKQDKSLYAVTLGKLGIKG